MKPVLAKPKVTNLTPQIIEVKAQRFHLDSERPERVNFGRLKWLGGLILTSKSPYFGGLSGLDIDPSGERLIAVSDAGYWLTARIAYKKDTPRGLSNVMIGPLLSRKGKTLAGEGDSDAEGISIMRGTLDKGKALVSFERQHKIALFSVQPGMPLKQIDRIKLPKNARRLKKNNGLEGVAVLRSGPLKGAVVAFAEQQERPKGYHKGWILGKGPAGRIGLKRLDEFSVTGLAALADGGLLVLERRFRLSEGIQMRIRLLKAEVIRRNSRMKGEPLVQLGNSFVIDNMEGIAAHRNRAEDLVITLISDDNFNFFQRTLLMQFLLPANGKDKPSQPDR